VSIRSNTVAAGVGCTAPIPDTARGGVPLSDLTTWQTFDAANISSAIGPPPGDLVVRVEHDT